MHKYGSIQSKAVFSPQLIITVSSPKNNTLIGDVEAVVDSGAVMTCIPVRVIESLNENELEISTKIVSSATGNAIEKITYIVNIIFSNHEYKDIEVIPLEKNYALIGRDILNKHKINLNGPQKKWSIVK